MFCDIPFRGKGVISHLSQQKRRCEIKTRAGEKGKQRSSDRRCGKRQLKEKDTIPRERKRSSTRGKKHGAGRVVLRDGDTGRAP